MDGIIGEQWLSGDMKNVKKQKKNKQKLKTDIKMLINWIDVLHITSIDILRYPDFLSLKGNSGI